MAVVNENSAQATARITGKALHAYRDMASMLWLVVNHTEVVAGDATSVQRLAFIPPGIYRLHKNLSWLTFSAFGASRTLALGWLAYVDRNGAAVAVSAAGLTAATDVSATGTMSVGTAIATGYKDFESRDGVWITSTVAGGTIPVGATIDGVLALSK